MKRWVSILLVLSMMLVLCSCGGTAPAEPTEQPVPPESKAPQDALGALREDMKPPVMAVASLGVPDLDENYGIMDYLLEEYPGWMGNQDFIRNMPEERIVRTCGEDAWAVLVCVVPKDPASEVNVTVTEFLEQEPYVRESVVYSAESGDPILVLADTDENLMVTVTVTDREGRGVSWNPYLGNTNPIPEDAYPGALVMDFSPVPENYPAEGYLDGNWYVPDPMDLGMTLWESDTRFGLEFYYQPGQMYDGTVSLYTMLPDGSYEPYYSGNWVMNGNNIDLDLIRVGDPSDCIHDSFPILMEPGDGTWLWIDTGENGTVLPFQTAEAAGCELYKVGNAAECATYDLYRGSGWYEPELYQLVDTFWLSGCGYALDLSDNAVAGDAEGWAKLYDVDSNGVYTESYNGSWKYEDGCLHLSLVPLNGNGIFVDETFPVLLAPYEEIQLFVALSESGFGLPHFSADQQYDVLEQPKG